MTYEDEQKEFKSQYTDGVYKEIVAFANSNGGVLYIGINDQGEPTGVEDVDDTYTRLTNGVRDVIHPDVTMFIRYELQDKNVICVEVGEGSYKPYYLKSKGLKPTGVFIRQGASSVQASREQIRQMIKESDGDDYEEARSLDCNLTFDAASATFQRYGVDFSTDKYRVLGITHDGIYTNLALLLSDQCKHTTKIAVFKDEYCTEFRDSREFGGSVFSQFESAVEYLALCNKTAATIKGFVRIEKQDYPEEAIREALINAIVHRDYGFSGSIIINVNDNKMEFISIGGLLPGISSDDIRIGISQPRNKRLAEVFHRLRLIENYGTGIRRIFKLYENCPVQPSIVTSTNAFKIVLPNMNAVEESLAKSNNGTLVNDAGQARYSVSITPQMKTVLDYIAEHGDMSETDLQTLLGIKATRAFVLARQMKERGLIQIVGRGATKKYVLPTSPDLRKQL